MGRKYAVNCSATNQTDLEKVILSVVYYYEDFEDLKNDGVTVDSIDPNETKVTIDSMNHSAEIIFKTVTYMDLPNVYADPEDKEMFGICKYIATILNGNAFALDFEFCDDWAGYDHSGECKFDGEKIVYYDHVDLDGKSSIEHDYSAEFSDNGFINEQYSGFDRIRGIDIEC